MTSEARAGARPPTESDAVDGVVPRWVAEPGDAASLAETLAAATAERLAVAPRGGGTKLGLGHAPARVDLVLSTARLDRVVEHAHADMTATVEAGCTMAAFQRVLAGHGQRLALDPPWPERATLGGVVAANDSGPLRTRFGSVRNLLLGATVALVDGTLARSGGKVVKNVAGYDLPKLLAGSLGTLGVVVEATFRLHPLPRAWRDATYAFGSAEVAAAYLGRVAGSHLAPACAQLRAAPGALPVVDVRLEGEREVTTAHAARLDALALDGEARDADDGVWAAGERLRANPSDALVVKLGALPASAGAVAAKVVDLGGAIVVHADGVGFARFEGEAAALARAIVAVRETPGVVHAVVLDGPRDVKRSIDVWGPSQDALELMRRVKARFDPAGTLNAGRFVGRI